MAILAGGLGTRLRSVLDNKTPKILAPVNGRPYLEHLFEWLAIYGARRIILCLGHLADQVIDHLKQGNFPFDIITSVEPEPLGTAGALRHARHYFQSDPILALNGDSFVDANLCTFLSSYRESSTCIGMVCAQVSDAGRFGQVHIASDNTVSSFSEKTGKAQIGFINAGAYLISASFLNDIAASSARSLEHDVFEHLPMGQIFAFQGNFSFIDIGIPSDLENAGRIFT